MQGVIAGEGRQNCEVIDLRCRVDALTPLELVVLNLVDMDGTVSALTTQVEFFDEEVQMFEARKNFIATRVETSVPPYDE